MIKAVMSLTNGLPKPIKLKICFNCNIEPTMMRSKSKYYCDCNCLSSDFKAITRESEEDAIIAWNVKQDIAATEEAVAKGELK